MLLVAALTVVGPGTVSLHAGEAPPDRGRPTDKPSQGGPAQDPPGQGSTETGGTPANETPPATSQRTGDPPGQSTPGTSGTSGGVSHPTTTEPEQPPPPPEPDLTGTRVLRSHLGAAREVDGGDEPMALRDLRVAVTETEASGIDGGWWVTVTTPDGEVAVTPPTLSTAGGGGVPRAPDEVSVGGGLLFWITGQRSDQRYEGRYEAQGTVGMPSVDGIEKPVVTILLVQ